VWYNQYMETICKCGHSIEEHDEDGCSVMTVTAKSDDFSRVTCCKCTLNPEDIIIVFGEKK